jgi:predicted ATP-grasp superfamily ATP-dependent carboligase
LGASCRAAAFSALRAGVRPRCGDYFADRDLAAVCPVDRIDSRRPRRGFTLLAESLPSSSWFYTGGFENHPAWVEQIARRHRLWGANARTLGTVRNPIRVAALLREHGIPFPAVRRDPLGLPHDGSWLVKPLHSGGGRGVRPLTAEFDQSSSSCYFQQRIDGPSFSALYVGRHGGAHLVGVTEQLLGSSASPFVYRGSIGPWPTSEALAIKLRKLGEVVARASELLGWFGIDYVLRDDEPWPVEINPRYTASVEVHELATGRALLLEHRLACQGAAAHGSADRRAPSVAMRPRMIAKLIVYAPGELIAPEIAVEDDFSSDPFALRPIADVPTSGTRIAAGEPVMTIFAWGESTEDCRSRVTVLERQWIKRLGFTVETRTAGGWK